MRMCMRTCARVCACARARACVSLCVCVCLCFRNFNKIINDRSNNTLQIKYIVNIVIYSTLL